MQVHLLPVWTWCIRVHLLACAWYIRVYLAYVCMVCAGTLECVCMCTDVHQKWQRMPCMILLWSPPLLLLVAVVSLLQSLTEPRGAPGVLLSPTLPTPSPRTTDASKQAHCLMWLPENSNSLSCLWNTKHFTYWAVSPAQVYVLNTYLCPRGSASRTLINDTQLMDSFSQWPKAWCGLFLQKCKTSSIGQKACIHCTSMFPSMPSDLKVSHN